MQRVELLEIWAGYRNLWNSVIEVEDAYWNNDPVKLRRAMEKLDEVMTDQADLKLEELNGTSIPFPSKPVEMKIPVEEDLPAEQDSDRGDFEAHLDKIQRKWEEGEFFTVVALQDACAVEKSQAYNILNYWKARKRIFNSERRGKYYWIN